jgi:CHAT domain-containing protein
LTRSKENEAATDARWKRELDEVTQRHEDLVRTLRAEHAAELDRLQQTAAAESAAAASAKATHAAEIAALTAARDTELRSLRDAEQQNKESEVARLTGELREARETIRRHEQTIEELRARIRELEALLARTEAAALEEKRGLESKLGEVTRTLNAETQQGRQDAGLIADLRAKVCSNLKPPHHAPPPPPHPPSHPPTLPPSHE